MKVFIYDNDFNLNNYILAVENCGHTPILSKDLKKSTSADALLLTGGGNIHPYFYGENVSDYDVYDTPCDISEFYLLNQFVKEGKRVIGVCKGMQVINVYFGGTIAYLENDSKNNHYSFKGDVSHQIILNDNSKVLVNSAHKQKIDKLGKNLVVKARSLDGVVECVKHDYLKIIGVQFHPERLHPNLTKKFYDYAFTF